jgi:hypothetical protein
MPWGRIDDGLYDHRKVLALPDRLRNAAVGLFLRAVSWSNRQMADGKVPNGALKILDVTPGLRAALIDVGLFIEGGDHVLIHDYQDFNELRVEIESRRKQAAEAGRMGGLAKRRAKQNGSDPLSDPLSDPPTNARAHNAGTRSQSRPVPGSSSNGLPKPESVGGMTRVSAVLPALKEQPTAETARLTKAQLDAWADFGPEWDAFKRAWFRKGLLFPPQGTPHDDDDNPSPRAMLYGILDARPTDLPKWVAEAPGRTQREVIGYVLDQWHAIRDGAPSR